MKRKGVWNRLMTKRRFFTVLILRPSGRRFRKLHLSYGFVAAATALTLCLLGAGLFAPRLLVQISGQSLTLYRLVQKKTVSCVRSAVSSRVR